MKKIGFICIFMYLNLAFADSIDNMLLESLYESREEAQSSKKESSNKSDSINTESGYKDNKESNEEDGKQSAKNTKEKQAKRSHNSSPFRLNVINDTPKENEDKSNYEKVVWFLGFGSETQIPDTNKDKSATISIGLQFGAFTYFTKAQAFRFSFIANYNALINQEFYSIGGAIDYFYNKRFSGRALSSVGVFIGSSISMPIYNNMYRIPNIAARIGLFATMISTHVEVYVGYPFYQDSKFHNILSTGINIHYFF